MYHLNYKFKLLLCGIVVIGFSLLISSSSVASSEQVLIIGTTDFVTKLSPANSYDYWTWHVLRQTSEGLVTIEPGTSKITPALAKSWEIDGTRYTFHLREGVTFWDGAPFNCQAMKWSLERNLQLDGPEGAVFLIKMIENISCIDSLTLQIKIDSPNATFLARLADIAPSLALSPSSTPSDDFAKGHYAGTGPYKLVEYISGDRVVYEVHDGYWGPQPKIQKVVEFFFGDSASLRDALESGEVDVAYRTFTPNDVLDLQENPDFNVIIGDSPSVRYIVFTVDHPPFSNVNLRRALSYSVCRDKLTEEVFAGINAPLYSMIPEGWWSYIDAFPKRDLDRARALLEAEGYSEYNPFRFTLSYTTKHYGTEERDVATVLKDCFEQTQMMEVELEAWEWGRFIEQESSGQFGVFLLGWYPDFIDPANFLDPWLVESPEGLGTRLNHARSSYDKDVYEKFIQLLGDARKADDIEERTRLYEQAQELLAESVILLPLWSNRSAHVAVMQKDIQGVVLDASMSFRDWLIYKGPPVAPPVAKFTATTTRSGPAPLTLQFLNLSTGDIRSYSWEFGDGGTSTARSTEHTYEDPGNYTVSLTVTGPGGSDKETKYNYITVTERNRPPIASFSYSPLNPTELDVIKFQDLSTDPDGKIDSWEWDFGDGSTSDKRNPVHQYKGDGTFAVKLTITDDNGAIDSVTKKIKVSNVLPKADFSVSPSKLIIQAPVTFDASASDDPDGEIESYKWNFGDGTTGSGQEVKHKFASEGKYEVKLTITDDDGATDSITKEVVVSKPPPEIKEKYAIVIGISDYQHGTPDFPACQQSLCDLKYPAVDAKAFYDLLVDPTVGSLPEENVILLTDSKATKANIVDAFGKIIALAEKDDLVIIYYSGHGGRGHDLNGDEGEGDNWDEYYIAYDTDINKLFATGIRDDEFGDWMNSLHSKQVTIFLDSCFSGGATREVKGTTPEGYKAAPSDSVFNDFELEDEVLISASQENQVSYESDELGHGVFTHFLLEGLKGEADFNGDNKIMVEEVYEYIKPKVKRYVVDNFNNAVQEPLIKGKKIGVEISSAAYKQVGKVTAIVGDKEKAVLGDKVMISLGKNQGVKVGDVFEVFHEYQTKAVNIEEVRGKIEVIELVGQERALCEVTKSVVPIEVGDQARKVRTGKKARKG